MRCSRMTSRSRSRYNTANRTENTLQWLRPRPSLPAVNRSLMVFGSPRGGQAVSISSNMGSGFESVLKDKTKSRMAKE